MNFSKTALLACLFFATLTLSLAEVSVKNEYHRTSGISTSPLKPLPLKNKFLFYLTSILSPQSFQRLPKETFAEIFDYTYLPSIDNFFVDARQLFTQAKKISENENLPEFHWAERYDFCIWVICFNWEVSFSTDDSKFIGAESITSSTEITPTSISNTFEIPLFNWTSPGFLINITDYDFRQIHLNKNSYYSFENVTIAFNCDYHFVPEVGIQLENLTIYYNAGRVRGGLQEFERWDFDGNLLERLVNDPEEYPINDEMMSQWGYNKKQYTSGLQFALNCFLSNGRSNPDRCENSSPYLSTEYYRLLSLELIQTLGLGALLSN